jgi:hypothetical protein
MEHFQSQNNELQVTVASLVRTHITFLSGYLCVWPMCVVQNDSICIELLRNIPKIRRRRQSVDYDLFIRFYS